MDKDFNFSHLVRRIVGIGNLNGDLYLALDDQLIRERVQNK